MRRRSSTGLKPAAALVWLSAMPAACTPTAPSEVAPRDQKLAALKEIAEACALPESSLTLIGQNSLHLQFPPHLPFESADCALTRIRRHGFETVGFVGNERTEPTKQ